MGLSATNSQGYVEATGTGFSDHIYLPPQARDYTIKAYSAGAFAADVQESPDGENWYDLYDLNGKVTIQTGIGASGRIVPAGRYRLNVTTYNSTITLKAETA